MLQQQNVDAEEKQPGQPMVGGANGEDGEKVAYSASAGDDDGQQSQSAQQSQLKPIAEAAGPPSSTTATEDQQSLLGPTAAEEREELLEEPKKRKSRAPKEPAKTEQNNQKPAFTRRRLSISLPNCAFSSNREEEATATTANLNKAKDQKHPQQSRERQQKQRLTEKEKSKGLAGAGPSAAGGGVGGGGGCHHRAEQRMQAFLGTCKLKETVEFLRGTIGRSRRKGADLGGGGGKDAPRPCPVQNAGNGVCPVPETVTASSSTNNCTATGNKKTGVVSFSQAGSAKSARKAVQSVDSCVADSFDEQMIDKICTLPSNMDRNEWLAAHVLALFEHVNGISCTLSEICTPVTCSVMSFPGNQKAPWLDERGKRHNYSAMRYIDSVMSCCEALRTNQSIFPTKYGVPFSSDFEAHSARIVRLLWHCLGHIYTKHWEHLGALNLRPQFGLVLTHLARLAKMYGLMTEKELNPVQNTIQLARPSCQSSTIQQRASLKRGMAALEDGTEMKTTTTTTVNPNTVQGRIQQAQQRKQQEKERQNIGNNSGNLNNQQNQQTTAATAAMMSTMMKSGSWGGQSTMVLAAAGTAEAQSTPVGGGGGILANCQPKCYAQTC